MSGSKEIRSFFWLWIPVLWMVFQVALEILLTGDILAPMHTEGGPHETLQFLILLAAFLIAVATLFRIDWKTQKYLGVWVALSAVCCLYVAGEEISWGQHLLKWSTPEFWTEVNDQNETNLHNTTSWLDQKPRIILQIGILVGGLIIPLLAKFRSSLLPKKFEIIYPPSILSVTALLALIVNMADRVDSALKDITLFERGSEVEELYMFWFVLLYLLVLRRRVLQHQG